MELKIKIQDYSYELPDERIAKYPLPERDSSKILIFKDDVVSESKFSNLAELLPRDSFMIFNNTKVVPARLFFKKVSGASIEIFCLEPNSPADYATCFQTKGSCEYKCVIGNLKKWKEGPVFFDNHTENAQVAELDLKAYLISKEENDNIVRFEWNPTYTFSEMLSICGNLPIPPYLHRETEASDLERYQTTYAKFNGSVAAPTAGLHFTERVLDDIRKKSIGMETVCLHVGAGTFLPVKSEYVDDHRMHSEVFTVSRSLIEGLLKAEKEGKKIIAVGTTTTRTLESLYYLGVKLIETGKIIPVEQWEPYEREYNYSLEEALSAIYSYLSQNNLERFTTRTRIIIVPQFRPRVVDILITNFHQPQSTLLLLVSAFVGERWKDIYRYAMDNGFRFLSYGDSSILWNHRKHI